MQQYSTIFTSYTSLLSSQTSGYEKIFHGVGDIKFELEECLRGSITKQTGYRYCGQ